MDLRAEGAIFVGFAPEGIRIFDPETETVKICNVVYFYLFIITDGSSSSCRSSKSYLFSEAF